MTITQTLEQLKDLYTNIQQQDNVDKETMQLAIDCIDYINK